VAVDPARRLGSDYRLFTDGLAPSLVLCRSELLPQPTHHGRAEVVGVGQGCSPGAAIVALRERGLRRIFIEGGGVTVSRYLTARCLHRLQLAVSPLIMGRGRCGLDLSQTLRLRPQTRRFLLAEDVLFECCFDEEAG
jgi:riboflavin biosynthesis pyrimidine reductase